VRLVGEPAQGGDLRNRVLGVGQHAFAPLQAPLDDEAVRRDADRLFERAREVRLAQAHPLRQVGHGDRLYQVRIDVVGDDAPLTAGDAALGRAVGLTEQAQQLRADQREHSIREAAARRPAAQHLGTQGQHRRAKDVVLQTDHGFHRGVRTQQGLELARLHDGATPMRLLDHIEAERQVGGLDPKASRRHGVSDPTIAV
jgi:hypothetical protein